MAKPRKQAEARHIAMHLLPLSFFVVVASGC